MFARRRPLAFPGPRSAGAVGSLPLPPPPSGAGGRMVVKPRLVARSRPAHDNHAAAWRGGGGCCGGPLQAPHGSNESGRCVPVCAAEMWRGGGGVVGGVVRAWHAPTPLLWEGGAPGRGAPLGLAHRGVPVANGCRARHTRRPVSSFRADVAGGGRSVKGTPPGRRSITASRRPRHRPSPTFPSALPPPRKLLAGRFPRSALCPCRPSPLLAPLVSIRLPPCPSSRLGRPTSTSSSSA